VTTTADIRNGLTILYNGDIYKITEFQHIKIARGGAKVRTKLKNLRTGQVIENTFRSGERIEPVRLDAIEMQYLYRDGDNQIFMNMETYEQIPLPSELFKEYFQYIKENEIVKVLFYDKSPIDIDLPTHVILEVVEAEPGVRGDTATGGTKIAKFETGFIAQVPLFVNVGDKVKIDTRTGVYCERVK
jgi:elongation factor P